MKPIFNFIFCLCITLTLAEISFAKEWRGIVPLQSTREDVEKLLGEPPPPPSDGTRVYTLNKTRSIYFLGEGEIYIVFAEESVSAATDCLKSVPAGTVLMIQITPKKELKLADLNIDLKKFRKFDPSEPKGIGYEGYLDETDGLVIRAFKGKVDEITYLPTSAEKHKCPSYYGNPEDFVRIMICGLEAR